MRKKHDKNFRKNVRKEKPLNKLEVSANELADAIYAIVSENNGVSISENSQNKINKILNNYYNTECTKLAI